MHTTRAQRLALFEVYSRNIGIEREYSGSYRAFRKTCSVMMMSSRPDKTYTILVPWCGMVLGIEPDGYTHS